MKIVCDSCGAKYSIADEKVAGRVFKIRCKKCGAAIVVRGDAGGAAAGGGGGGGGSFDYGGEAVWHVVVDGDQQGPFTPVQLGQMISANTIGWLGTCFSSTMVRQKACASTPLAQDISLPMLPSFLLRPPEMTMIAVFELLAVSPQSTQRFTRGGFIIAVGRAPTRVTAEWPHVEQR